MIAVNANTAVDTAWQSDEHTTMLDAATHDTDATRLRIWALLSEAFGAILRFVQTTFPDARMTAGHNRNEAFLFRAYAAFSAGSSDIVISFDIQMKNSQAHICGDIARENDIVIEDVMQVLVADPSDDVLLNHAKEFASRCEGHAALIAEELSRISP